MNELKIIGPPKKNFDELGGYWVGDNMTAASNIRALADTYKLKILKQMNPIYQDDIDPQNLRKKRLGNDLVVSIKRDGMYNILYYDERTTPQSIFCNSPYGRARYNLPVNREFEDKIQTLNESELLNDLNSLLCSFDRANVFRAQNKIFSLILAGELFARINRKADRPRIMDVLRLLWNPSTIEDLKRVAFDVFDLLAINKVSIQTLKYKKRLAILNLIFSNNVKNKKPMIQVVNHLSGVRAEQIPSLFNKWVLQERNEGLIITNKYGIRFKLKTCYEVDVVIIGFALSRTQINGLDNVGSVLVALMKHDGCYQVLTSVESGFTNNQKIDLLNLLKNEIVPSYYNALNEVGMPFQFVRPKYVLEMRFIDVITEDTTNQEILGVCLTFKNNSWYIENKLPFLKLINPWFKAFRSEVDTCLYPSLIPINPKEPIYNDVKIDQFFPLLNKLSERGASFSKNIMKELLHKRLNNESKDDLITLASNGYFNDEFFTQKELQFIAEKLKHLMD